MISRKIRFIALFIVALYIFEALAIGITFSYLYGPQKFIQAAQSTYLWLNISYMNAAAIITFSIVDWIYPVHELNARGEK